MHGRYLKTFCYPIHFPCVIQSTTPLAFRRGCKVPDHSQISVTQMAHFGGISFLVNSKYQIYFWFSWYKKQHDWFQANAMASSMFTHEWLQNSIGCCRMTNKYLRSGGCSASIPGESIWSFIRHFAMFGTSICIIIKEKSQMNPRHVH